MDQELYANPETKAYFDLFMRIMGRVRGETPAGSYEGLRASREMPLFETLKDQPRTELKLPESVTAVIDGDAAELRLNVGNEKSFARLVRVSTVWDSASEKAPYLETYSDNCFDLLPGENKSISVRVLVRHGLTGMVKGHFTVQGSNVPPVAVPIALQTQ